MKIIKLFFITVIITSSMFAGCSGKTAYNMYTNRQRSSAGLEKKYIQMDNYNLAYLEGGQGETIVFIHGFGAEKDYWTPMSKYLKEYHVVIPDLPGSGESEKLDNMSFDIEAQADRIDLFVRKLNLGKIFIAGNSMGGHIAGIYAVKYPDNISGLILINNAGINSPEKSDLMKNLEQGKNPLILNSVEDFDNLLYFGYYKKPYIPSPIKTYLAEEGLKNKPNNEKVWKDMMGKPMMLEDHLVELSMPVLIIWGANDRIIDVSCVGVMENKLKKSKTHIIENCGHAPMLERPEETAGYIKDFIEKDIFEL